MKTSDKIGLTLIIIFLPLLIVFSLLIEVFTWFEVRIKKLIKSL